MKRFFTLVELMVVIGIIVILAGILLPTLAGGREKAAAAKCMSNMKQLGGGMALFASDNNNCLVNHSGNGKNSWAGNIFDYIKETKVFYCEADENDSSSDEINIGKSCLVSYVVNTRVHKTNVKRKLYDVERASSTASLGPRTGGDLGREDFPTAGLNRHGKTANYLFVDGHAEVILKDVFEITAEYNVDPPSGEKKTNINKYWNNGKTELK